MDGEVALDIANRASPSRGSTSGELRQSAAYKLTPLPLDVLPVGPLHHSAQPSDELCAFNSPAPHLIWLSDS